MSNGPNVIDVGCAAYGGAESISYLVEEFNPRVLIGFDPSPTLTEDYYRLDDTLVIALRMAAWTHTGEVRYLGAGTGGYVIEADADPDGELIRCVDLVPLIGTFAPCVLKIDAEGAEYPLLRHIIERGADEFLTLAWIEWHGDQDRMAERKRLISELRCEVAQWSR